MKIMPENIMNFNRNAVQKQGHSPTASNTAAKSSDCDKITIGSNPNADISDAAFISQLKKTILSEVQVGASEHKLEDLKQQIAMSEYDVNVPDLVRKIMFDPEVSYE